MSVTYLECAGVKKPLQDWGISRGSFTRTSFGRDQLQLVAPGLLVTSDPLFADDTEVVLWSGSTRRFTGTVTSRPVYGSGRSESHTYTVTGPWGQLERLMYQESRYLHEDPTNEASPLVETFSTRAVLFANLAGVSQTPAQQITAAIAYAASKGVQLAAGSIVLPFQVPWEEASDISCGECIKRGVRWSPDAIGAIDYSPATPVINIARRADLPSISINLTAANLVTDFSCAPRSDLKLPGVRFYIEDIVTMPDGKTRGRMVTQSAGNPDAIGALVAVIELGAQGTDTPEPTPANLAINYYSCVSTMPYEGTITLKQRNTDNTLYVGAKLNFTNGRPEWETMNALIQEVTEDLFTGVTTARFGPSATLSAQAFIEFLRYQNQRKKSSYLATRITGEGTTSAVPSAALSGWLAETIELELCNPERTVRVQGTVVV
jgi:hypothetical protein